MGGAALGFPRLSRRIRLSPLGGFVTCLPRAGSVGSCPRPLPWPGPPSLSRGHNRHRAIPSCQLCSLHPVLSSLSLFPQHQPPFSLGQPHRDLEPPGQGGGQRGCGCTEASRVGSGCAGGPAGADPCWQSCESPPLRSRVCPGLLCLHRQQGLACSVCPEPSTPDGAVGSRACEETSRGLFPGRTASLCSGLGRVQPLGPPASALRGGPPRGGCVML